MSALAYYTDRLRRSFAQNSGPGYKALPRQVLELFDLALRGHVEASEYYSYGFSREGVDATCMARYLPGRLHWMQVLPRVNEDAWNAIVENKWLFHRHYESFGLPLPRMLGVLHPRFGMTPDGVPLRNRTELHEAVSRAGIEGVVLKPVAGGEGRDVSVFRRIDVDHVESIDGSTIEPERLEARIAEAPDEGLLVEERVQTHPFFHEINPYTATTLRVVTLRDRGGEVHVAYAAARIGRKGAVVDNTAQGGFYARIDLRTGRLDEGHMKVDGAWKTTAQHPDSGVEIADRAVPGLAPTLDAVRRAAEVSGGLNSIGWDIIPTEPGPVIIEGNHDWDPLHQLAGNGYLQGSIPAALASWGLELSADGLPPRSWRGLAESVGWVFGKLRARA